MTALDKARQTMLDRHLRGRGISNRRVLAAMAEVPREEFVRPDQIHHAYADSPLPSAEGQTISQPFIVALMMSALHPEPHHTALDIGAGTGYAAAVLSRLTRQVYAIEYHASLTAAAEQRCRRLGYDNIEFRTGDGSLGWPDQAPFDSIHVAACAPSVPAALIDQLAADGRLLLPLGTASMPQKLVRLTRAGDALRRDELEHVRFVPLIEDST
ncbi:protein-L-isoaspartate(D-aspartate) O-methyltransferase [Natronospirillum operosum]|uniref:Protein-L-isoaspartate O-methyltransferase n=1 Tax=Natronospirillum operosum TaxID=2759953 RepID=A0A4Z0W8K9_9GAMM|nr:protein-L-isoaspartate(D-aspartate) O-methyltransferase [Natronospirillum operosum]TGG94939.1 protein-L-isoaspartate(D-aspartate) O-methyltransferase [Natronospirillum operosum]